MNSINKNLIDMIKFYSNNSNIYNNLEGEFMKITQYSQWWLTTDLNISHYHDINQISTTALRCINKRLCSSDVL